MLIGDKKIEENPGDQFKTIHVLPENKDHIPDKALTHDFYKNVSLGKKPIKERAQKRFSECEQYVR